MRREALLGRGKVIGTMPANARGSDATQVINAGIDLSGSLTGLQVNEQKQAEKLLYPKAVTDDSKTAVRQALAFGTSHIDQTLPNSGILQLRRGQIAYTLKVNPAIGTHILSTSLIADPSTVALPVRTSLASVPVPDISIDPTDRPLYEKLLCHKIERMIQPRGIVGPVDGLEDQRGNTVLVVDGVISYNNTSTKTIHTGALIKASVLPQDDLARTSNDPDVVSGVNPILVPEAVYRHDFDLENMHLWQDDANEITKYFLAKWKSLKKTDGGPSAAGADKNEFVAKLESSSANPAAADPIKKETMTKWAAEAADELSPHQYNLFNFVAITVFNGSLIAEAVDDFNNAPTKFVEKDAMVVPQFRALAFLIGRYPALLTTHKQFGDVFHQNMAKQLAVVRETMSLNDQPIFARAVQTIPPATTGLIQLIRPV